MEKLLNLAIFLPLLGAIAVGIVRTIKSMAKRGTMQRSHMKALE